MKRKGVIIKRLKANSRSTMSDVRLEGDAPAEGGEEAVEEAE